MSQIAPSIQTDATYGPAAPVRSRGWSLVCDYVQLAKLRITAMVVITAYIGFGLGQAAMAQDAAGRQTQSWLALLATLAGTALSCMGAGVLNQMYERDTDGRMIRTRNRPLPAGRVCMTHAAVYAALLCVAGVGLLAVLTNLLTAGISALTIAIYALIYTPMKRISSTATIVGAVPGALPPVMGYTATTGRIGIEALAIFGILFLWQLPHFLAIAWLYREDYARGGFPFLPVLDPAGGSTFRQILLGCLALLPVGLLPTMIGACGMLYFIGAMIAGAAFLAFGVALIIGQSRAHARAMFFASLVYLPVVLTLMLMDLT